MSLSALLRLTDYNTKAHVWVNPDHIAKLCPRQDCEGCTEVYLGDRRELLCVSESVDSIVNRLSAELTTKLVALR